MNKDKIRQSYIKDLIFLAVIAAFAFWVNRNIVIKGLYMDDLYMWSCYGEQSLTEFVFPIGTSTRFRPVYWFATYLQMMIVGNHITRFVTFNIIVNVITAYLLYHIARKLSRSSLCALITGLCYLASRFAYYQIGQALGLMETMALFLATAMLWQLYRYMEEGRGYWSALIIYFLLVFTHERYLSLFPLIYLVLVIRMLRDRGRKDETGAEAKLSASRAVGQSASGADVMHAAQDDSAVENKSRSRGLSRAASSNSGSRGLSHAASSGGSRLAGKCLAPIAELLVIIGIRCFAIGKALPAGTGGTEVTDTFSIGQTIGFCFDQVKYILGINAGPEYLNGLTWEDSPSYIRKLVCIGILLICIIAVIYIVDLIRRHSREVLLQAVRTALLFCGFIALCIGCSSVTIRLEMRWIYVSYAAALLYASYMIGSIGEILQAAYRAGNADSLPQASQRGSTGGYAQAAHPDNAAAYKESRKACTGVKYLAVILFAVYAAVSIYLNIFYRGYYIRLYLWPNQLRMNSLAEQTVEKYGIDGVLGKDIYILGNSYEMSEFYADTFFKTFDPDMKAEGTEVIFIDSIEDADRNLLEAGEAIVLKELPEDNAYQDITEEVLTQSDLFKEQLN